MKPVEIIPIPNRALLTAGLCLFGFFAFLPSVFHAQEEPQLTLTVEIPAGRTILRETPTPYPTPTPEVRKADILKIDAELKKVNAISNDLKNSVQESVQKQLDLEEQNRRLGSSLKNIETDLTSLRDTIQRLDSAEMTMKRYDNDLDSLNTTVSALQQGLEKELAEIRKFKTDFQVKENRLEGVIDLMNAMRKDLNDNAKGIVDLQKDIEEINKPPQEQGNSDWLEKSLRWPYMPVVAAVLSAVALGVALSK